MKLPQILLIALLSIFSMALNAQVIIGGNIGFSTSSTNSFNDGTTPTTDKNSNYGFGFMPYAGIHLSEKFVLGAELKISLSHSKGLNNNIENIYKSSTFGIAPFLRYYAIKWNKLSLFAQGKLGIDFSNSTRILNGTTWDKPKSTRLYFNVYPAISYDINDKFSLETTLNFLSLGYSYISSKDISGTDKTSSFNMGAGLDDIISFPAITIGAIYKF